MRTGFRLRIGWRRGSPVVRPWVEGIRRGQPPRYLGGYRRGAAPWGHVALAPVKLYLVSNN